MTETKRKYTMGGYHLPVTVEFQTLSQSVVRVVDAKGRLVKRFTSANMARELVKRMNEPSNGRGPARKRRAN